MAAAYKCLKLSKLPEVSSALLVKVSRPDAMNALNDDVLTDLEQMIESVQSDRSIRVVILTGDGEKAFVAGADIKQFESMSREKAEAFAKKGQDLFGRLAGLPQPVIAAVNGFALGGGLELALACDFIVAAENAKFALPECSLGLIPGFGGTVRLPRMVGSAKALELALTGTMIGAEDAYQIGLVSRVVPPGELMMVVGGLAGVIASRAPKALEFIKSSVYGGREKSVRDADQIEAELFGKVFSTVDKIEGVRAFIEKRKPQFRGT